MAFFAEKGISVPFAMSGTSWRYTRTMERVGAEEKLDYLRKSIKPMARELCLQVGEKEVLDALGLWHDNCVEPHETVQLRLEEREAVAR